MLSLDQLSIPGSNSSVYKLSDFGQVANLSDIVFFTLENEAVTSRFSSNAQNLL